MYIRTPLLFVLAFAAAAVVWAVDGVKMSDRWGESAVAVLSKPEGVEAFRINSTPTDDPDVRNIEGYPIEFDAGLLTTAQTKKLSKLLLNPANHHFYTGTKRCGGFQPGYAFRFLKSEEWVNVLVCFACTDWQISSTRGRTDMTDFAAVRKELSGFCDEVFDGKSKRVE